MKLCFDQEGNFAVREKPQPNEAYVEYQHSNFGRSRFFGHKADGTRLPIPGHGPLRKGQEPWCLYYYENGTLAQGRPKAQKIDEQYAFVYFDGTFYLLQEVNPN